MRTFKLILLAIFLIALPVMAWDNTQPVAGDSTTTPHQLDTKIVEMGEDLYLNALEKGNVLELDNEMEFTPDADYEPSTKKYVDDALTTDIDADNIDIKDAGEIITASEVEAALQENRTAINLNTDKNTNVPTALSVGTIGGSTVAITSDGGADDVTLPAATVSAAGMLTTSKWGEIVANNGKLTNVSTTLSIGTNNTTVLGITSDGGADDVSLPVASTTLTGVVNSAMFDNYTTLTNDSMSDTLHRHSELSASDGTPDQALVVDATGQVGIGTAAPTVELDVTGDAKVSGSLSIGSPNTTESSDQSVYIGQIENDAAEDLTGGQLVIYYSDETDATEDCYWGLNQVVAGTQSKAYFYKFPVTLADGAQLIMPTGLAGFGTVIAIGTDSYTAFTCKADGTVELHGASGTVTPTSTEDNDTTLNVFDNGSGIGFENELGSEKTLLIDMTFTKP